MRTVRCNRLLGGCLDAIQSRVDPATDRQIKVNTIPLYKHVAFVTEADDILDEICVVYIRKSRDWLDVMNVECSSKLGLVNLTSLAQIAVELASEPLQGAPIGPVVFGVTTPPTGIAYPTEGFVRALRGTEAKAPSGGKQASRKSPVRTAHFARPCDRFFAQNAAAHFAGIAPRPPTGLSNCIWFDHNTLNETERAPFVVTRA